jgi:hypothetical protein
MVFSYMRTFSFVSIFSIHILLLMAAAPMAKSRDPWISTVVQAVKLKKSNGSTITPRPGPVDSNAVITIGTNGKITILCPNNQRKMMPAPRGPVSIGILCGGKTASNPDTGSRLPAMAPPVSKMQTFATGKPGLPTSEGSSPQLTPAEGESGVKSVETSELKKTSTTISEPPSILIVTPRNTSILETKPVLRWNPVSDLDCCTISQVNYGGKTPLKPGNTYQFQVKSNSGAIGLTTFEILTEATAKRIRADIATLQKKNIGEEAKVLALANLERDNSLYSAAIDRLSKWLSKSSKNPAPYQLLADLYMQIELPEKARSPYITALDLTRKNRTPKEEAKSLREEGELLITLGIVDGALGDRTQSISWLEKAQQLYTKLKDNERIQEVKERLIDARANS